MKNGDMYGSCILVSYVPSSGIETIVCPDCLGRDLALYSGGLSSLGGNAESIMYLN